jgi:uncharacterized protein (DUF302 family)
MAQPLKSILLAAILSATGAWAQQSTQPAQPSPEQVKQMQAMMQRQMQLMAAMFDLRPSRLGFDETVNAVQTLAGKHGWKVGEVEDMGAKLQQAGHQDAKRMKVIPTCPPQANERVAKAGNGKAPPLSCRVTVFEGKDGKTMLMRMNTANMAKMVPDPALAKVLAEIGAEEEAVFKDIVQ